jgi:hypothetical protein
MRTAAFEKANLWAVLVCGSQDEGRALFGSGVVLAEDESGLTFQMTGGGLPGKYRLPQRVFGQGFGLPSGCSVTLSVGVFPADGPPDHDHPARLAETARWAMAGKPPLGG